MRLTRCRSPQANWIRFVSNAQSSCRFAPEKQAGLRLAIGENIDEFCGVHGVASV